MKFTFSVGASAPRMLHQLPQQRAFHLETAFCDEAVNIFQIWQNLSLIQPASERSICRFGVEFASAKDQLSDLFLLVWVLKVVPHFNQIP